VASSTSAAWNATLRTLCDKKAESREQRAESRSDHRASTSKGARNVLECSQPADEGGSKVTSHKVNEALEIVVQRLVAGLCPERIILFGSHAYGDPTGSSDLDFLIIVSDSTQPPHRRAQEAYRCVGSVGVSKDLLVLTHKEFEKQARVVTSLARRVKATGKVLYERSEAHRDATVAHQGST